MFLGRAAVIGILAKRKQNKINAEKQKKQQKDIQDEKEVKQPLLQEHHRQFIKNPNNLKKLEYSDKPLAAWFLGFTMLISSLIILFMLINHRHYFVDDIQGISKFWKFVITFFLLFCSLGFLYTGQIESIVLSKKLGMLTIKRYNIFFQNKQEAYRNLEEIKYLQIVKRGHQTFDTDTTYYILQIHFEEEEELVEVLECRNLFRLRQKYVEIMAFCSKPIDFNEWIGIIDQTTNTQSERQKRFTQNKNPKNKAKNKKQGNKRQKQLCSENQIIENDDINNNSIDNITSNNIDNQSNDIDYNDFQEQYQEEDKQQNWDEQQQQQKMNFEENYLKKKYRKYNKQNNNKNDANILDDQESGYQIKKKNIDKQQLINKRNQFEQNYKSTQDQKNIDLSDYLYNQKNI